MEMARTVSVITRCVYLSISHTASSLLSKNHHLRSQLRIIDPCAQSAAATARSPFRARAAKVSSRVANKDTNHLPVESFLPCMRSRINREKETCINTFLPTCIRVLPVSKNNTDRSHLYIHVVRVRETP